MLIAFWLVNYSGIDQKLGKPSRSEVRTTGKLSKLFQFRIGFRRGTFTWFILTRKPNIILVICFFICQNGSEILLCKAMQHKSKRGPPPI